MKRRQFLGKIGKLTAFSAIAPTIIPSSALGKSGYVAPSNRVALSAIGLGGQGTMNTRNFLSDKRVEVVALCDVCKSANTYGYGHTDTKGAEVFKQRNNLNVPVYEDYRELLAKSDIDAVSVSLPDHWHAIAYIDCANAGKDVFGEKPLTRTIEEGRVLCEAVKRNGIIWQTGSWQRSLPKFRYVAELIRNGVLGKVHKVEITLPKNAAIEALPAQPVPEGLNWDLWQGPAFRSDYHTFKAFTTWRFISAYSAGKIADWGAHHIDIAHWALGYNEQGPAKIKPVSTVWPKDGFYDQPIEFRVLLEYENGEVFDVSASSKEPGVCFYGEKGKISISRSRMDSTPAILTDMKVPTDGIRLYGSDKDHWRNFIDSVIDRRACSTDIEIAHRTNSACLLSEIAYRTGRTIKWDWKTEKVIGDASAQKLCSRAYYGNWQLS